MLIDEQFRRCVAFICVDIADEETGEIKRVPAGTAFFVGMHLVGDRAALYLVTARHVVEAARGHGAVYVRANREQGGYTDSEIDPDVFRMHPIADVAAAAVDTTDGVDFIFIQDSYLMTDELCESEAVSEGDELFFVGLFPKVPGTARSQPIVRFGRISLMPQEPLLLQMHYGSAERSACDAYLAESHSWGGYSGAPAFVVFSPLRRPGFNPSQPFALLGLVHGHYEIEQDVDFLGDALVTGKVPVNAGLSVVMPAQRITEVLMDDEWVAQRDRICAQLTESSADSTNPSATVS